MYVGGLEVCMCVCGVVCGSGGVSMECVVYMNGVFML